MSTPPADLQQLAQLALYMSGYDETYVSDNFLDVARTMYLSPDWTTIQAELYTNQILKPYYENNVLTMDPSNPATPLGTLYQYYLRN